LTLLTVLIFYFDPSPKRKVYTISNVNALLLEEVS